MAFNVLVADDSMVARSVLLKTLRSTGLELAEVYQAADGRQAVAVLAEHWIDLLFLDVNMPVMNGLEVVEHVRKHSLWADLPIVIVSTEGSETRIERLLAMGVKFIHKPYTPEALRAVVLKITGGVAHEIKP